MGLNKPNTHCSPLIRLANNLACVVPEDYHGWLEVCIWQILLQKSFCTGDQKFCGP